MYARSFSIPLLLGLTLGLSGCISSRTFVDPSYGKVGYGDLARRAEPLKLRLVTQFQRNGQPLPGADPVLREQVERVLRVSGLVVPAAEADGELRVTLNNIADLGAARAAGFGTGLTFGLAGNVITDAYEMQIVVNRGGKAVTKSGLKHALHTAVGNATLPAGVEVMSADAAFARVVEQMLLNALQDLQKGGELSRAHPMWERFLLGRPYHATPSIRLGG